MKKFSYLKQMPKWELALWMIMRAAMAVWCISEFIKGDLTNGFQAFFSLIFTHLWDMFQLWGGRSFIKRVSFRAQTALNIFIFFGSFLADMLNLFLVVSWYDVALHVISGAVSAWFGYDFAVIIQGKKRPISPALAALFSIGFAFAIAIGWEFYEFSMDTLHGTFLQCSLPNSDSGLIDTMTDLIACTCGALPAMFLTAFQRNGYIGRNCKERRRKIAEEKRLWDEKYEKAFGAENAADK